MGGVRKHLRRIARKVEQIRHKAYEYSSGSRHYVYNIDSPKRVHQPSQKLEVEGWIISKIPTDKPLDIRIRNNNTQLKVKTGIRRRDVKEVYGKYAEYSGFKSVGEFDDGEIIFEVKHKGKYRKLESRKVSLGVDHTPKYFYNKDLAWRYAEHQNLIESRKQYFYEEDQDYGINLTQGDPRLIAIYLPQFHPFAENDEAWGKGFTEWTNVTAAQPRFVGHHQPVLPSALGFYDLRVEGKLKEQIDLAKKHGIAGFSFYYYWFSGKKIMDGPVNMFLAHPEWNFNFSICWANENWTKRWDGRDSDIIIAQQYNEDDPINFIKDVENILLDSRYLKKDGKPILTVYRLSDLKDPKRYAEIWRDYFKSRHDMELYLVSVISFDDKDPRDFGFDAAMDFAPLSAFFKNKYFEKSQYPYLPVGDKLLDVNFEGVVADYRTLALRRELIDCHDYTTLPCVTPSWDNDARKKGKGFIFQNVSPNLYAKWLDNTLDIYTKKESAPIVYLNAWNEWAEGAMLEPSQHLGYATLNRTSSVLMKYIKKKPTLQPKVNMVPKLAVIIHLYYIDCWDAIYTALNKIPEPFDVHVSLSKKDIDFKMHLPKNTHKMYRYAVPNRGRDVLPFVHILTKIQDWGYDYVLKLHSKKTTHYTNGSSWLDDLLTGLLPSNAIVEEIINKLNDKTTGVIGPVDHIVSLSRHMGANGHLLENLLSRSFGNDRAMNILANRKEHPYFGGTMFWARMSALKPLVDLYLLPDDFHSEHGQLDGTLAHAVERYIGVIGKQNGHDLYTISKSETDSLQRVTGTYNDKYSRAP